MKPYQPGPGDFIGDVMGVGWHRGRDLVLFNAFDWEHLRKRLVQMPGVAGLGRGSGKSFACEERLSVALDSAWISTCE